jgi:hypothetical protein
MRLTADVLAVQAGPLQLKTDDDQYWKVVRLEAKMRWLGYETSYEPDLNYMGSKVYGLTNTNDHHIYVEGNLHWNDRYAVLAHEAGHVLQPGYLDRSEADIFAETVSVLVAGNYRESARWLATSRGTYLFTTLGEWRLEYAAAEFLLE